ncbi:protein SAWADEE HOMEODOMAIN [Populus alba x Populus x berolinensis]|nr:protein SAWADEE HOMEODOMAIN [Populus alba x Populus x berolinensis]
MGRPPSNGGPSFRFMQNEVTEMEAILQEHNNTMPAREVLVSLAEKFSESPDRKGNIQVQMKQVWNWFQNRRYAIRAKSNKTPMKLNITPMPRDDLAAARGLSQQVAAPIPVAVPATTPASSAAGAGRATSENSYMEFEAKSARDGAWYDVGTFLSHRYLDKGDPEVLVRFAGFGPDEDEWLNVCRQVRQRSLPCEASECVAVLPGDLILCFQEIVPLRKICRRPETDYRLLQLHAANDSAANDQKETSGDPSTANAQRVAASALETTQQQQLNSDVAMAVLASQTNVYRIRMS